MRDAVGLALGGGSSVEMQLQLPVGVSWAPDLDALPPPSDGAFGGPEPEPEPFGAEEGVPPVRAEGPAATAMAMPVGMAVAVSYELPSVAMMDDAADGGWAVQLPQAISWVTQVSFAAAAAANRPVPSLPVSRAGAPKPAVAWIAGAIYWVALQPRLQTITGVSVTPVDESTGRPAEFIRQKMQATDPKGRAIASLIREILKACDSGIKLEGWDAVRKQLSGDRPNPYENPDAKDRKKWWQNNTRGGNGRGDHSQTYTEECPYLFQVQMELFESTKPYVLQEATTRWLAAHAPMAAGGAAGGGAVAVPLPAPPSEEVM